MTNVIKIGKETKKEITAKLSDYSPSERAAWLSVVKAHFAKGDMTLIADNLENQGVNFFNVRNVFSGTAYNEQYGPIIVEEALSIVKLRMELKRETDAILKAQEDALKYLVD